MQISNEKMAVSDWDSRWQHIPFHHTTALNVAIADRRRLIAREITPGCRYIEIGCAPGSMLAYAQRLGAEVSGLDYSSVGIDQTRAVLQDATIPLYCEDILNNSVPRDHFDVVHSAGLIEHFEDPTPVVRAHVELLKKGGVALITVPHFGGIYGRIAKHTDSENLALHNLRVMSPEALTALAPSGLSGQVSAFTYGRMSLSSVCFKRRRLGFVFKAVVNVGGLLQFFPSSALAPYLVLRIVRVS